MTKKISLSVTIMYPQVLGRRPQGELLGWFASFGSAARMVVPIASGYIIKYFSADALFGSIVVVLLVSTALVYQANQTLVLLSL